LNLKELERIISNEERLRLILSSTTEGWWEWNVNTNQTYHSPHWYEMLGFQPDEFASSFDMWTTLMHPEDRERAIEEQHFYMQREKAWEIHFRMRTVQNDYRWIASKGKVVERDQDGNALLVVGIHLDITEKKKLEQIKQEKEIQEELMKGIIRVSHSSFKLYDFATKKFMYTSSGIYQSLGYTKKEFLELGKDFILNFIHPEDQAAFSDYVEKLRVCQDSQTYELVFRMKAKNQQYHWMMSRDAIFRRDTAQMPTQVIGSVIDITPHKELEDKIEQHLYYLEELSYRNAHDLRGPVATLLGLINVMEFDTQLITAEKMLAYFKRTTIKLDQVIRKMGNEIDQQRNK